VLRDRGRLRLLTQRSTIRGRLNAAIAEPPDPPLVVGAKDGKLLTLVAVESGGWFMLRVLCGHRPATDFQRAFFRAGHAHASVLVILSLVAQLLAGAASLNGVAALLSNGIWVAAILMPAGFFLSAAGRDRTQPNQLIVLLYAGVVALGLSVISLGLGLLTAPA
jgi:hypothetical protein